MRLLLVIFLLSNYCAFASINNDSLLNIWNNPSNSKEMRLKALDAFLEPSKAKMQKNADLLIDSFCVLAKEIANPHYILKSYIVKGRREYIKSDFSSSISYFEKVIDMSLIARDTSALVKGYNGLGINYMHLGNIKKANECYFKSLDALKFYSNEVEKGQQKRLITNNISGLFYKLGQYDEAFKYSRLSVNEALKQENWSGVAGGYINLSIFSKEKGDLETALLYLDSGKYFIDNKEIDPLFKSHWKTTLAEILVAKKDTSKALEAFNEALQLVNEIGNTYHEIMILSDMAVLENDSSSIRILKIALKKAKEINVEDLQIEIYERLYLQYKKIGEQDLALEMLELSNQLDNSSDKSKSLSQLLKHEYSRKNEELQAAKKSQFQKLQEGFKNKMLWIVLIAILLVVAVILYFRKQTHKQNRERAFLMAQIDSFKKEGVISDNSHLLLEDKNAPISKEEIQQIYEEKLNESDRLVLACIYTNQNISIKEIGEKINLSYEGVRSSLKKMYRLFEVPNSKNMKLALVLKVMSQINSNLIAS